MKWLLLLFGISLHAMCFGQTQGLGLKIGPTFAQTNRVGIDFYEPLWAISADAFYHYQKKRFVARSSVGLNQRGFTQALTYVDEAGNVLGEGAIEKVKYNYLSLAQTAGISFGNQLYCGILGGFRFSHYLNSHISSDQFTLDDGGIVSSYSWKYQNLKKIDLSILLELELGVKLTDQFSALLLFNYDYGMLNVDYHENLESGLKWKYQNASIQLGVNYTLPDHHSDEDPPVNN